MPKPVLSRVLDAPSGWQSLDPVAAGIKRLVDRVLPPGRLADLLHGVPLGHPSHPPLAQAALSGWSAAAVLGGRDLLWPSGDRDRAATDQARATLALVGVVAAAPTVTTGWADWSMLHEDQQRTGLVHSSVMATALSLSLAGRIARSRRRSALLDLAAGVVATAGAALGGHLAYRWSAGANHAEAFPHLAREGWSRVCPADQLHDGQLVAGTAGDEPVVIGRVAGQAFAMADRCSHLGGPLHEGSVERLQGRDCVVCPWHHSAFAVADGAVARGPATAPQPRLEVRTVDGWLEVRPVPLPGVAGR